MLSRNLAPIGIGTYSRLRHLQQTINALQKNTLAQESELYIFSDAPRHGDEERVAKLREYIHTITGFKQVHIIERENNNRIANNRGGIKQLLDKYGKMIWMEDDIITAPGFLQFMNDGLNFYKDDPKILSITGYCPPIKTPQTYSSDAFILQRFNGWGLATWKDKFNPFNFALTDHNIDEFFKNKYQIKQLSKNGEDIYDMLVSEYKSEIDALDVKIMFYQFKYNLFTAYPRISLVQNNGFDGSGLHCGVSDRFDHDNLWEKLDNFKFEKNIQVDERIRKANSKFRSIGIKSKLNYFAKKVLQFQILKMIKSKL